MGRWNRLVLPLTEELSKSRLFHDARYFSLDTLNDLPRYVTKDSFQTVLDDKSGYDHILLTESSQTFFGIQWGGCFFTYHTLPFGWKISPFIYHTTGLLATGFFRSIGIPCLLYIDDRHNGQLQVSLDEGEYGTLSMADERYFVAAKSTMFLVTDLLLGETGLFPWFVKIYFDPSENCFILWFPGGLINRSFSFNSREETQIHCTCPRDT